MSTTRLVRSTVVVGLAAFALAGCSLIPSPEQIVEDAVKDTVEETIEEATGVEVGDGTELPADWPGLPTPNNATLVSTLSAEGIFSLTYTAADAGPAEQLVADLTVQGFTIDAEGVVGELSTAVLTSDEWSAQIGWLPDGDGAYQITYSIAPVTS